MRIGERLTDRADRNGRADRADRADDAGRSAARPQPARRAVAEVRVGAIRRNVERLVAELADGVAIAPVVKADGYGHGADAAAAGALAAGARTLCVATAAEARALRGRGLPRGVRLIVVGALSAAELPDALAAGAELAVWDRDLLRRLPATARVHVKLDSGLGRLGTRDARLATELAEAAGERLAGLWTHLATADERDDRFFAQQLDRFARWALPLRRPGVQLHAANSAALLRKRAAHFDMVRPGVAIYGLDPFGEDPAARRLEPALRLTSWVAAVKRCRPGESAGYGRAFAARAETTLATVPIGYGDGWRRAYAPGEVAIGGRRFPLAGTIAMDNLCVDLGPDGGGVAVGDEVALLGDGITAEQVAARAGTINYEVTTGLSARVVRRRR